MSRAKRKLVTMIVTVSVKNHVGALEARRQVRQILESELTWDQHMKLRAVSRMPADGIMKARRPRPSRTIPPLLAAMGAK